MANTFGTIFRITSFGESHGEGIGVVIDGCPAGLTLDMAFIQAELDRRRPGQSRITTQRKEPDTFQLLSGHMEEVTTGTPLCFWVPNTNARSRDYAHIATSFRPSHADFTYHAKYGTRDYRGGGRSSARETIARVIGGALAKLFLRQVSDIQVEAWVESIQDIRLDTIPEKIEFLSDAQKAVRCPDPVMAQHMYDGSTRSARRAIPSAGSLPAGLPESLPDWGNPFTTRSRPGLRQLCSASMLSRDSKTDQALPEPK